ncbi:MAG: cation:proton antiporter [Sedimentisphaerales bacterium]|nr:cation:proton antiporter [Sedimentisphaerales bacterium]
MNTVLASTGTGMHLILLIGTAIFFGTVGARVFQKLKIPQIIGFIVVGVILGPVLGVVPHEKVIELEPFNLFALGLIGFLIGGELKREIFVKFGKQVSVILLFEGLVAFLLVGTLSLVVMLFFASWQTSLAVAVVFGAICAATDPASTISVLWEYKARGPLTTMLTALVALDDALALVLYAIGVSVAGVMTGHQDKGLAPALGISLWHIAGSVLLGVAAGLVLHWILDRVDDDVEKVLAFVCGTVLVVVGVASRFHMDVIIATMVLGVLLINIEPRKMASTFELMHRFSAPVYVLFFVLVGARLQFAHVNAQVLWLVAAYVFGSVVGKTSGSYLGGLYARSVHSVRHYLGFCLYPQGGIAVGLLIMASRKFDSGTSALMLLVVILGAFVLQIIGPLGVKFGAKKAGELGLNVTEEDLIKAYSVGDIMDTDVPVITAGTPLCDVIQLVSRTRSSYYSVVDNDNRVIGAITMDGIRSTFATQELHDWLVALDIVEPVAATVTPQTALAGAIEKARDLDVEQLPVVTAEEDDRYLGILDERSVRRRLSAEVLAKQKEADNMYRIGVT